jgi:hypothetical protein
MDILAHASQVKRVMPARKGSRDRRIVVSGPCKQRVSEILSQKEASSGDMAVISATWESEVG